MPPGQITHLPASEPMGVVQEGNKATPGRGRATGGGGRISGAEILSTGISLVYQKAFPLPEGFLTTRISLLGLEIAPWNKKRAGPAAAGRRLYGRPCLPAGVPARGVA